MKILIITHKVDIDGHGAVVLANLAFSKENVDYILAMPGDINDKFDDLIKSGRIDKYDKIYVTDICFKEPLLDRIDKEEKLKNKLLVLDHHVSIKKYLKKEYNFVKLEWEKDSNKVCGTSMFYDHLIANNLLQQKKSIYEFVELTRRYDTWEWKEKYIDETPNRLSILMEKLDYDLYIEYMTEKLEKIKDANEAFEFTSFENSLIDAHIKSIEKYIKETVSNLIFLEIDGYKAGVCFAEMYRNDIKEYIISEKIDMDILIILKIKDRTISYRKIKGDIDANEFARKYGGGGIKAAAGSQLTIKQLENIAKEIFK